MRVIFKHRFHRNKVLSLHLGDIADAPSYISPHPVGIVVNPSNIGLQGSKNKSYWMFSGRKNVDTRLHELCGPDLQRACDEIDDKAKPRHIGAFARTPAFNWTQVDSIVHVVTPRMNEIIRNDNDKKHSETKTFYKALEECYSAPLLLAYANKLESVAR